MAIQMRRGPLANYDPERMVAGEWAIPIDEDTNNQKAFIAFAPGVDKEVMFVEDAATQIEIATARAIADATEESEAWAHGNEFHVNDYASGDGTTTAFTLAETPDTVQGVYVNGSAVSAYTVSGNVITFSSAPSFGVDNIHVVYTVDTTTDNSKYYKEQAALSAASASSSESNAATSASESAGSATEAGGYATSAYESANRAMQSATDASESASSAAYSSENAADSAAYAAEVARTLDLDVIMGNFATVETTFIASRTYKVGEHLVKGHALYRVITEIAYGGTIVIEGANANVVETNVGEEVSNRRLWFKDVTVNGITGSIIDCQDSRITSDYVLEGNSITWGDESKITSLTNWSTDTAGHFIVTGVASSATTATFALVKADDKIEPVSS